MDEAVIYLSYLNGTGYIFNVDDYMKLRTDHRIVGSFVGASNARGWSSNSNSLPVELTKLETQLLIEKKLVKLVKKQCLSVAPTAIESQNFQQLLEERLKEQENTLKDGKIEQSKLNIDKIMLGKRKKLLKSGIAEKDIKITEEEVLEDIRNSIKFDRNNALLDIPTEHPFEHDAEILDKLPNSENTLRYRIFKDIWEHGMFLTSGEAFGADFIAYPGDPMVYHASHIIIILNDGQIKALDLIAKCRLSVIVNKICLFAYENSNSNNHEISYQIVHWEGNKERERKT